MYIYNIQLCALHCCIYSLAFDHPPTPAYLTGALCLSSLFDWLTDWLTDSIQMLMHYLHAWIVLNTHTHTFVCVYIQCILYIYSSVYTLYMYNVQTELHLSFPKITFKREVCFCITATAWFTIHRSHIPRNTWLWRRTLSLRNLAKEILLHKTRPDG